MGLWEWETGSAGASSRHIPSAHAVGTATATWARWQSVAQHVGDPGPLKSDPRPRAALGAARQTLGSRGRLAAVLVPSSYSWKREQHPPCRFGMGPGQREDGQSAFVSQRSAAQPGAGFGEKLRGGGSCPGLQRLLEASARSPVALIPL